MRATLGDKRHAAPFVNPLSAAHPPLSSRRACGAGAQLHRSQPGVGKCGSQAGGSDGTSTRATGPRATGSHHPAAPAFCRPASWLSPCGEPPRRTSRTPGAAQAARGAEAPCWGLCFTAKKGHVRLSSDLPQRTACWVRPEGRGGAVCPAGSPSVEGPDVTEVWLFNPQWPEINAGGSPWGRTLGP